ncbi:MAG: hypothetical protein DHS20C15_00170 [Planctomycetota bacterium]|nr:MAG: hypothetical protein DHS20C15_00170 [Planctomycetota bacterium]
MSDSPAPSPDSATPKPGDGTAARTLDERLERNGMRFEAGVLEQLVARSPEDPELLAALAQSYAVLGEHGRGLELDQQLVTLRPEDDTFRYNLACSLCLVGELDGACGELLAALDRGYRDFAHLLADDDLAALRADARFGLVRDRMASLTREH